MKNFSFAILFDAIFLFFSVFLLSLVFLRIYLSFSLSIILSLFFSTTITLISVKKQVERLKKNKLSKAETEMMNNVLNQLCANDKQENLLLIKRALENKNLGFIEQDNGFVLSDKNALIYPCFSFDGLKKSDVIKAFNKIEKENFVFIMTKEFSEDVKVFAEKFNGKVKIMDGKNVYTFLKNADALPKITLYLKPERAPIKTILKSFFYKGKAKRYFFFGTFLLLFSFITPYKFYYIASGAFLMLLSLFCRFYGKKEKSEEVL